MTTEDHTAAQTTANPQGEGDNPKTRFDRPMALLSNALFILVLILAAIPPALSVADRWFNLVPPDWNRAVWCQVDFLCQTQLPSYFMVIFACFLSLALILFFVRRQAVVVLENPPQPMAAIAVGEGQRRIGFWLLVASGAGFLEVVAWSLISGHWPGWDLAIVWLLCLSGWALRAIPLELPLALWKQDREYWISLLILHLAVVLVLAAYYDVTQVFYLSLLILLFACANAWRFRRRIPPILWIMTFALIFYTININAWWTAFIGDEYGFHNLAWAFAEKMSLAQIGQMLFQADGVFFSHPYFSSFLQAISMKLLGHDGFGWRFSNLYLCSLGIGLFYLFCKSFISRRSALIAACLLAFSHYVMTFGKIGYNNLQALFVLCLVLALSAWALRWKEPLAFALLGSSMALCFYLFPASLYVVPLPILLLLFYYPPLSRRAVGRWLVMVSVWAAMLYPLLIQPAYWATKKEGTLFNRPELVQSVGAIVQHFAQNILYSVFSFTYIPESHYITTAYVDPLSAIFVSIGYFVLLYQLRRQRFAIFTALTFVFFLFSVGSSHDRDVPPDTRMFLMLPLFALFGTWGILWVEENIKRIGLLKTKASMALAPLIVVAIMGLNLYQAYVVSYTRYEGIQYVETLFVAMTQKIHQVEPDKPKSVAVLVGDSWGIGDLLEFQNVYPHLAWFHLYQISITQPVIPEADRALLSDRDTIIMVSPFLDQDLQSALDVPLLAMGKAHCDALTPDGQKRFVFYYAPDIPQDCPPRY